MMNENTTTLLIMAAGMGSRYGGGIKQLESVDEQNHIIMDYSINDAIEAGFNKIVFVIRKDIEAAFREAIGGRIEAACRRMGVQVAYGFQALDDLPEGASLPEGRTKPWGTGQAVLAARKLIHEPFAVINADDYYGKKAFVKIHDFLCDPSKVGPDHFCMAGFVLKNTLSDHGAVTRGICHVDDSGHLLDISETPDIVKTVRTVRDGEKVYEEIGARANGQNIDPQSWVSMNMWGFAPEFMDELERGFEQFFAGAAAKNPLKAEYLLPIYIGELLQKEKVSVEVLETNDRWFGVTYKEDKPLVVENFRKLIEDGVYTDQLFY